MNPQISIELLDDNHQTIDQPRDFMAVAEPFLNQLLGDLWKTADPPVAILMAIPGDDNNLYGDDPLTYHTPAIGYIQLRIHYQGRMQYYHPHSIVEVLTPGLRQWLSELSRPPKAEGYRIKTPNIRQLVRKSTPIPKGVTEITPYAPGEQPSFRIRPIPPPSPELNLLKSFDALPPDDQWVATPDHTDFVNVLIEKKLHDEILYHRQFSNQMEEGGFLVGQIFENQDQSNTYIAHVKAMIPAEQVGASFLHFTFTGDSFERIKQRISMDYKGQRLLGWFHTHLFPAYGALGLSTIDLRLHFTTFRIPWQIAGLINLDGHHRVLRFYVRQGDVMPLCYHQTINGGQTP
jgi:proteasome lid subunit RPN8/RPN11